LDGLSPREYQALVKAAEGANQSMDWSWTIYILFMRKPLQYRGEACCILQIRCVFLSHY
jgi:hypothetical protein